MRIDGSNIAMERSDSKYKRERVWRPSGITGRLWSRCGDLLIVSQFLYMDMLIYTLTHPYMYTYAYAHS